MQDSPTFPNIALVQRLILDQFPKLADHPIRPLASAGTDHAIYRLGEDLIVRLPIRESAAAQVVREQQWLPRLAPDLPLKIPQPLYAGARAADYPWSWSICPWLEGQDAANAQISDLCQAGDDLGRFLAVLRRLDAVDGPRAGHANHGRGVALTLLDARVRNDIARLGREIDAAAILDIWETALAAPAWSGPGAWLHGDLHPSNLLVREGRLVAVLDFGLMGVGDPAADLFVAWSLLDAPARTVFRRATEADDSMWSRGRGWAVFNAVIALAFYLETNPMLCRMARRTFTELMGDV
jgi:aminoglycoside phosphotransferase (APT) family kinase protein